MLLSARPFPRGRAIRILAAVLTVGLVAGCRPSPDAAPAPDGRTGSATPTATTGRLVTLTASAEPAAVAPGGTVTLIWRFHPAPGWHLYGNGRNDSGFAPRLKLALPPGWIAGPLQWPAPTRHVSAGDILDHVYESELVLVQDITVADDAVTGVAAAGDTAELRARWEWLACRESCVPGRDSLSVAITVTADAPPPSSPSSALQAARARLPRPLPPGIVSMEWMGASLRIVREPAQPGRLTFMPAEDCGELADLLHDGVGEGLSLRLSADDGRLGPVRGVLLVEETGGAARAYTIDVPAVDLTGGSAGATTTGG